jgi:hypothetical protein
MLQQRTVLFKALKKISQEPAASIFSVDPEDSPVLLKEFPNPPHKHVATRIVAFPYWCE